MNRYSSSGLEGVPVNVPYYAREYIWGSKINGSTKGVLVRVLMRGNF